MKILFATIFSTLLYWVSEQHEDHYQNFILKPISKGVWAAIHKNPGGHAICNAGIIDQGNQTVIIDPFMNLDAAEELKAAAMKLTSREASIVINTHHHNDHIRGNQLFPSAEIISTQWTKEAIPKNEPSEIQWEKDHAGAVLIGYKKQYQAANDLEKKELILWIDYFEGIVNNINKLKTTLPTKTFTKSYTISGDRNTIELIEYKNAHTQSDAAVFIMGQGIVFAGDMLFHNAHPWLSEGNPDSLKNYLDEWIKNKSLKVFVPGHGNVTDVQTVKIMRQYINDIQRIVAEQKKTETPDSVILKTPIPEAYKNWNFSSRFFTANLAILCK